MGIEEQKLAIELNGLMEDGILDKVSLQQWIDMKNKEKYLNKHPYKVWAGKNGNWYTYLPDEDKGRRQIKRNTKEKIEEAIISYWENTETNITVKKAYYAWMDRRLMLHQISESTYSRYDYVFIRHFGVFGKKEIKKITAVEVAEFLEEQVAEHKLNTKAFSSLTLIMNGIINYAKKHGLIMFTPYDVSVNLELTEKSFSRKIKEDYEEVFDETDMEKIIPYLLDNQDIHNLGILLMFATGLRVGEITTLKPQDLGEKTVNVRRTESRYKDRQGKMVVEVKEYPKTKAGVRTVALAEDSVWILKKVYNMNPFGEYAFMYHGHRITAQSLRNRLKRVCAKVGVYVKSPHKVRKTYGTILLDNGIDRKLIEDQMGHTSVTTTEKCYHINRKKENRKIELMSQIPELKILGG